MWASAGRMGANLGLKALRGMGVAKHAQRPTAAASALMRGPAGAAAAGGSQIIPTAQRTVPGMQWGNAFGTGLFGLMGYNLMSGEDQPPTSERDLEMAMLLQQLQGAGFQGMPQETMMDPGQSMMMRQDPTAQSGLMNERISAMSSYAGNNFLEELMQENAQLIAQISQRQGQMSQQVDPIASNQRRF